MVERVDAAPPEALPDGCADVLLGQLDCGGKLVPLGEPCGDGCGVGAAGAVGADIRNKWCAVGVDVPLMAEDINGFGAAQVASF